MTTLAQFLATHPTSVSVEVTAARGSTPRDAGTVMIVADEAIWGTIGGGQLEFMAIDHARGMLRGEVLADELDIPLGPEIGQCCGGRTVLRFATVDADLAQHLVSREAGEREGFREVVLFGGGHVGLALARALSPLPFRVTLIESREIDLSQLPDTISFRHVAMPEAEVAGIASGGAVVILTHDHALDFLIAERALLRDDLAYVGMIGSATKRATFAHWLAREGHDALMINRLVLPIGGSLLRDKRPEVIAALVAAELLCLQATTR
ncbi:xanthine dehydrogenase accessory protein XdhC [Rhizobium sp. RU36D]|uniref:xanthine dehydrogenase accessory protein XdhC n=1 Tax=Rhizobium sp. RU36D TaxID=1907415 RepID=UPI0009D7E3F6|nr:xanthine dehydrogenase accessory protein XdhC [Rhizobium sp. RU36D]SMD03079.1 molybdenum cofactor sulfurylase [Rhizobium sp. RU36D]